MNLIEMKRKNDNFLVQTSKKICELVKKAKKINSKNLVGKIHKLIIEKLKLNVNHHIKTCKNHNLLQV
jgi:hypothetical protein